MPDWLLHPTTYHSPLVTDPAVPSHYADYAVESGSLHGVAEMKVAPDHPAHTYIDTVYRTTWPDHIYYLVHGSRSSAICDPTLPDPDARLWCACCMLPFACCMLHPVYQPRVTTGDRPAYWPTGAVYLLLLRTRVELSIQADERH
jgi:hypothetical protein